MTIVISPEFVQAINKTVQLIVTPCSVSTAPCGLRILKNRPDLFPGPMS